MLISDMDIPLISIEVTPDIATKIRFLGESGFFSMRRGKVTVNFDNAGNISSMETHTFAYPQAQVPITVALKK
jgi:capsule polysaccharide export protein KpsE/RkpR